MVQTLMPPRPTLEDPEPASAPPPVERRRLTARDAFVTILVCFGVWAIVFAPVLERRAETGPVGARRTVALAVLRPLAGLSDALALDGASEVVMRALGRDPNAPPGGSLELPDLDLPSPPRIGDGGVAVSAHGRAGARHRNDDRKGDRDAETGPADPAVRGIRTPTEDAELRVVVVGDSLSQGLGPALAEWFDPDVTRVLPLGRQSTGLARQDYFNWRAAMREIAEELRPDLVFVLLGSNDNQAQVRDDGSDVPVGSVEWVQAYRQRAAEFLREATSAGTRVVWVGIPVVRDRQRWDFYRRVNQIYEEAARADPLATYLDAWDLLQTRDGQYTAFLRNERGVLQEMRAGDGIHLTPAGYGYLARAAIRIAAGTFDLPQRAVGLPI